MGKNTAKLLTKKKIQQNRLQKKITKYWKAAICIKRNNFTNHIQIVDSI